MILTTTRRHRVLLVRPGARGVSAVHLPPGVYRAERVANPLAPGFGDWIVLRGRMIGQSTEGWRRYEGPKGSVTIEEEGVDEQRPGDDGGANHPHPTIEFHRKMLAQVETQRTIGEWAKATFPGGDDLSPRHCLRLLEEVVELCLAAGATPLDVYLAVSKPTHAVPPMESRPESPEKIAREMADCAIVLDVLAERRGVSLRDEVDSKMKLNRIRTWKVNGDGTGYHVKEAADAGPGGL